MTDKQTQTGSQASQELSRSLCQEQIMIDGKKYNKCEGCELYDGYMCNGARSYEPEGEAHRAICDKHIAQEFWKVYNQLARKTQECKQKDERILELMRAYEELKEKLEALKLENQEGYEIVAELKHECEELKRKVKLMMDCPDCKVDEYKTALEEIEEVIKTPCKEDCVYYELSRCYDCIKTSILDIINKAKGGEDER